MSEHSSPGEDAVVGEDTVLEDTAANDDEDMLPEGPGTINIRNLSIRCGHCDTYQTLSHFQRRDDWNVYAYECENDVCDPATTRTYLEVPAFLDEFAHRDPSWRGGKVHAGAEPDDD